MTDKETAAVAMLKEGISWKEAARRTGFTEDRLKQLYQSWCEVQQAKNEALKKAG